MIDQILSGSFFERHFVVTGYLGVAAMLFFLYLSDVPYSQSKGEVLGVAAPINTNQLPQKIVMATQTNFGDKVEEVVEEIPYDVEIIEDDEMEYGEEKVKTPGEAGKKTLYYKVTYWKGTETARSLIETKVIEPVTEVVYRGTKVIWREISTEVGTVKYWRKMRVWATKYDANCYGCLGRTYSGTKVQQGVCAVDPKVMPMGTYFYVEGYGVCHAEDIGGAIKGNKIDLGYEDASKSSWGAGWKDIYLMSSAPEE